MTKEQKLKALRILQHYDSKAQMIKCCEELSELETAILQHISKGQCQDKILEEMADTYIMLEQLLCIMPFGDNILEDKINFKLDRQLQRIRGANDGTDNRIFHNADTV